MQGATTRCRSGFACCRQTAPFLMDPLCCPLCLKGCPTAQTCVRSTASCPRAASPCHILPSPGCGSRVMLGCLLFTFHIECVMSGTGIQCCLPSNIFVKRAFRCTQHPSKFLQSDHYGMSCPGAVLERYCSTASPCSLWVAHEWLMKSWSGPCRCAHLQH